MIIICKECSTKFKLDESFLKPIGSKVRCCVCKHIFTVYPPQALGQTSEAALPHTAGQQGYFDSEETLGPGGVGGFQKSAPEPDDDDDGLELDVDEEEDMELDSDEIDLGDDNLSMDDGGIDLGNKISSMDSGMNFDEDMDTSGLPGMDFADANESDIGEIELDTKINLNLDQGDELELDADSDLKKDAVPETDIAAPPSPSADSSLDDDEEDFEFEFELDEEDKLDEEELSLDDLPDDLPDTTDEIDETQKPAEKDDLEFSLDGDDDDLSLETEDSDIADASDTDSDESPDEVELEIDDDIIIEDDMGDSESYEIEEVDEFEDDDDDEYEIEEYEEGDAFNEEFDEDDEYEDDDDIMEEEQFVDDDIIVDDDMRVKPKKKKSGKLLKVLIAVLLIICFGYGAFIATGGFTKRIDFSKIDFSIVKNLFNPSKMNQIPSWATINQQSVNGRLVNNEKSGNLFVITGKITNSSTIPINNVRVAGVLMSKGNIVAKKKTVYCGNTISEKQLAELDISSMNRILQRADGEQKANIDIKANESIPFMIVFSDLPKDLDNYSVTIVDSKRIKKK